MWRGLGQYGNSIITSCSWFRCDFFAFCSDQEKNDCFMIKSNVMELTWIDMSISIVTFFSLDLHSCLNKTLTDDGSWTTCSYQSYGLDASCSLIYSSTILSPFYPHSVILENARAIREGNKSIICQRVQVVSWHDSLDLQCCLSLGQKTAVTSGPDCNVLFSFLCMYVCWGV